MDQAPRKPDTPPRPPSAEDDRQRREPAPKPIPDPRGIDPKGVDPKLGAS